MRGEVRRFELPPEYKVPHMGWNELSIVRRPPMLAGIEEGTHFYFVHSYYVAPTDPSVIAAQASYPEPFTAMVWRERARERRQLLAMGERELHDIAITRVDALREASKPLWKE